MKPSTFTTAPIIISGLALCLVSLYMLYTNQTVAQPPAYSLPVASDQAEDFGEDWRVEERSLPSPAHIDDDEIPAAVDPEGESQASIASIRVPGVGIDAPVETKGVDSTGAMQNPHGPSAVAWYDFSATPGTVGNIVMSGHVDYYNYGPAVFWHLKDLEQGDRVEVTLTNGETFIYEVASLDYYTAASAPVGEIVGATPFEALTLITCGGSFDSTSLEYDDRLVVRATRVHTTAASDTEPGR